MSENYSTYRFTLDIHQVRAQVSIPVFFQDTWVRFLFNLTDGGKPYTLEEVAKATLFGKKADGTSLVEDCNIIENNTRIEYTFSEQTASALGPVECEIRLYSKSGRQLTSPSFTIVVEERVLRDEDIIESETEKSAIDRILDSEEAIKAAATKAEAEADRAEEAARSIIENGGGGGGSGKSAYEYAQEGGYQGTEEEFAAKMAEECPTKLSELENDEGFIDAKGAPVQSVNSRTGAVTLAAVDVGADPAGTASGAVGAHNTHNAAHNDIRLLIQGLSERINAALNSDDTTLDQLSEIVAYIKSNKALIDVVTTSKVNVSDIVNDLVTNVSYKPLSAAQGVALMALITSLDADKLDASALTNAINTALAQAQASGDFDGVGIAKIECFNTVSGGTIDIYTITLTDGNTTTFEVRHGEKGAPGESVTVSNVSESTASGGSNVVTFSDGKKLTVKNGKDGDDYVLTSDDLDTIAARAVIKIKEGGVVGYIDENNNIILSGNLAKDTYTIKYEMEDGSIINIGDLELVSAPTYTNLFDPSAATLKQRISSSGSLKNTDADENWISDYIEVGIASITSGEVPMFVKNANMIPETGTGYPYTKVVFFDASKAILASVSLEVQTSTSFVTKLAEMYYNVNLAANREQSTSEWSNIKYMRVQGFVNNDGAAITNGEVADIIITINEPIE